MRGAALPRWMLGGKRWWDRKFFSDAEERVSEGREGKVFGTEFDVLAGAEVGFDGLEDVEFGAEIGGVVG